MTRIERIEQRVREATAGEWMVPVPTDPMTCVYTDETNVALLVHAKDAEFIAASKDDITWLLSRVRKQHELLEVATTLILGPMPIPIPNHRCELGGVCDGVCMDVANHSEMMDKVIQGMALLEGEGA